MKHPIRLILCPLAMILSTLSARSEAPPPFLRFDFDEVRSTPTKKNLEGETVEVIHEVSAGGQKAGVYRIGGYHDLVDGVAGKALMFDGYSTRIAVPAEDAPEGGRGTHRAGVGGAGRLSVELDAHRRAGDRPSAGTSRRRTAVLARDHRRRREAGRMVLRDRATRTIRPDVRGRWKVASVRLG